jgi:ABC-type sugar transport system substrate-binding protein
MAIVAASALVAVPTVAAQDASPPAATDIEIAYVLHGLNAFTERIQTGAQDAARDYGVTVEVFGDASFDTPTHQAFFENALQRGFDGIAVVPNPGDQWITPLQQATDQGVPMVGANITALDSTLRAWVGQNEYNSGVILGGEVRQRLEAAGVTEGTIPVGICIPAAEVLQERDLGFRRAFEGRPSKCCRPKKCSPRYPTTTVAGKTSWPPTQTRWRPLGSARSTSRIWPN